MRNLALAATVAALMVAPLGCILAAVKETTVSQPSGGSSSAGRAQCLVKITCDQNLLPLDRKLAESILKSPNVGKEAAQEVFGESVAYKVGFDQPPLSRAADGQRILIGQLFVEVFSEQAKPRADEFLDATCKRLRQALVDAANSERQSLQDRLRLTTKLLGETESKIAALERGRREAAAQVGLPDPSRDRLMRLIASLDSRKQSLEMSLAGMKARQAAVAEQVANLGAQTRDRVKDDAIAAELAKIVTIREVDLQNVREAKATDVATAAEVRAAEARLAEAKVKLAERREAAKGTGRLELLDKLSNEIVTLGIDTAEKTASLKVLSQQVAKLKDPKVLDAADRYDREVKHELRTAQETRGELTGSLGRLRRQLQAARTPTLTVIGSKPGG